MSRRKGDLSRYRIDMTWPHQVAIPHKEHVARWLEIDAFCRAMPRCPRTISYVEDSRYMDVLCFAERADAEQVAARFGGRLIDPKDRPRWGRSR